jgi:hypothetical protein
VNEQEQVTVPVTGRACERCASLDAWPAEGGLWLCHRHWVALDEALTFEWARRTARRLVDMEELASEAVDRGF